MSETTPRLPQVFDPNDPRLSSVTPDAPADGEVLPPRPEPRGGIRMPTTADLQRGLNWGLWLFSSAVGLIVMAALLRFWTFVWSLFERKDWIGWTALGLAAVLVVSAAVLLIREVVGLFLLVKLQRLRRQSEAALADRKEGSAKSVLRELRALYVGRPELAWARADMKEHDRAIMTSIERLGLFDRVLMATVDDQARQVIAQSARRVAVVTAITPFAVFDMGFVLYENLRMMRRIATCYGGRPGFAALFNLFWRVFGHVIATGGLAMTDDLFGQFVGQGIAKRLSARAGQGMFNGGLTARLGIAAIEISRPLPFIEAKRPRFRDLALEVGKGLTGGGKVEADGGE